MDNSSILGIVALVISVGGAVVGIVNHKKVKSKCCGKSLEASLDIESTTPTVSPERRKSLIAIEVLRPSPS